MHLDPHDYYYVNIDLCHQYGTSAAELQTFLCGKRPQRRIEEGGETAVFPGYIDLVTVFDAICRVGKLVRNYSVCRENLMSHNFRNDCAKKFGGVPVLKFLQRLALDFPYVSL